MEKHELDGKEFRRSPESVIFGDSRGPTGSEGTDRDSIPPLAPIPRGADRERTWKSKEKQGEVERQRDKDKAD